MADTKVVHAVGGATVSVVITGPENQKIPIPVLDGGVGGARWITISTDSTNDLLFVRTGPEADEMTAANQGMYCQIRSPLEFCIPRGHTHVHLWCDTSISAVVTPLDEFPDD